LHLDALVQDQAGRELIATVSKLHVATAGAVLSYMGLFRPAKSDLSNGRALKLLNEILSLTANENALCQALEQTYTNISTNRRENSDIKPLSNHNYLKKVLQSIPAWDRDSAGATNEIITRTAQQTPKSVGEALLDINNNDWAK
jgi:hypothetical protein